MLKFTNLRVYLALVVAFWLFPELCDARVKRVMHDTDAPATGTGAGDLTMGASTHGADSEVDFKNIDVQDDNFMEKESNVATSDLEQLHSDRALNVVAANTQGSKVDNDALAKIDAPQLNSTTGSDGATSTDSNSHVTDGTISSLDVQADAQKIPTPAVEAAHEEVTDSLEKATAQPEVAVTKKKKEEESVGEAVRLETIPVETTNSQDARQAEHADSIDERDGTKVEEAPARRHRHIERALSWFADPPLNETIAAKIGPEKAAEVREQASRLGVLEHVSFFVLIVVGVMLVMAVFVTYVDAVVRVQKGEAQSLAQRLQQAQLTGDTSGPTQIA